jgi:hypothetical protein
MKFSSFLAIIAYVIGLIFLLMYALAVFGPEREIQGKQLFLGDTWLHVIVLPAIISYLCMVSAITVRKRFLKITFAIVSLLLAAFVYTII